MRTWKLEMLVVAALLAGVAHAGGSGPLQWLTAAAVLLSFGHMQVANRLEEAESARPQTYVHCRAWLDRYLVAKELMWAVVFTVAGAWPALLGCAVFALYPAWRRWRRR